MNRPSLSAAAAALFAIAACGTDLSSPSTSNSSRALSTATPDSPAQGATVYASTVTLSGRSAAAAGTKVTAVALDAAMKSRSCTASVTTNHTWSCGMQLPDGGYSWSAQPASGPASDSLAFVVSTWSVPAPIVDALPPAINDARPVVTGTVSSSLLNRGYHLEVTEKGATICIVDPITSTSWSCALPAALSEGAHVLASDVDKSNGDELTPSSNPVAFTIKTRIGTPTIAAVPSPTNVVPVSLSGTGEPSASLTIAEGGAPRCQVTVSAGGSWRCAVDGLPDGGHSLSATQADSAGNVSAAAWVSFTIDRHVPGAPAIDPPASPASRSQISLSGAGEPGDTLTVADSYSRAVCSAAVGNNGSWSCSAMLTDGDYLLTATQATATGTRSGPSAAVPLSVRTLLAPLFDILRSPTRDATPLLGGKATAGARIVVSNGEGPICSTRADSTGAWSCKPASPLADGPYLLQARSTDDLAHTSDASSRSVVIDTTAPGAPVLAQMASPTRKQQPTISGTAEASSAVAVTEATSGANICSATADTAGAFHCTPDAALANGAHPITATATDAAGNTSLPAQIVTVVISQTVPARPTIDSPADGSEIEGHRPVIGGHTAAGTLVQVSLDGVNYAAQVDGQGLWVVFPPSDLTTGAHQIDATATDAQQNTSDPASSRFQIVETGFARGGCSTGGMPIPLLAVAALLFFVSRSRRSKALSAALAVAAMPSLSRANELDVSLFRPAAGGDGFAAIEGARPPLPGETKLELRTWTDFAIHPLSFVSESGTQRALVRSRTGEFLGAQAHLIGPLSLAVQVPLTLGNEGDLSTLPPSSRGPSSLLGGFGDLRLTPRLALLREEWAGVDLATQASFELPTASADTMSSDGRVRAEGLIALGRHLGSVPGGELSLLTNAYVRLRPPHEFLDVRTGNEAGLRGGLGMDVDRRRAYIPRRVYLELEARTFLRSGFASGSTPAEWRLGGTLCPAGNLAIDLAGGGAMTDGVGAPRARFLFGFGYSPSACGRQTTPALASATLATPPRPEPVPAPVVTPQPPTVAEMLPLAPPQDSDGDGIPDVDDACPDQPGPRENHGCPRTIRQRVVVSASRIEILDKVLFASGRRQIDRRSYPLLDQVAAVLNSHPDLLVVQVEGHTDSTGSGSHNLLLSQARAEAVAAYLESRGVDSKRLRAKGFGQSQPIDGNATAKGRAANRRVAFTVLKMRARTIEAQRPADS